MAKFVSISDVQSIQKPMAAANAKYFKSNLIHTSLKIKSIKKLSKSQANRIQKDQ